MTRAIFTVALVALALPAHADGERESGVWQVIGDKDGKPDGRIRTFIEGGELVGVVDALRPDVPLDAKCTRCSGALKDRPILGMRIMWGFYKRGDTWTDGRILEPQSGSTYRCRIKLVAPDRLEVHGYIGIPLLGRTQKWARVR
jgi:uncharacterized protein (DUF2147 family)